MEYFGRYKVDLNENIDEIMTISRHLLRTHFVIVIYIPISKITFLSLIRKFVCANQLFWCWSLIVSMCEYCVVSFSSLNCFNQRMWNGSFINLYIFSIYSLLGLSVNIPDNCFPATSHFTFSLDSRFFHLFKLTLYLFLIDQHERYAR